MDVGCAVGCAIGCQEIQSDGCLTLYSNTVESWPYQIFMCIYVNHLHKSFSPEFHHCKIPSCEHWMDIHVEQKHLQTASHPPFLSYQNESNILMLFLLYTKVKREKQIKQILHRKVPYSEEGFCCACQTFKVNINNLSQLYEKMRKISWFFKFLFFSGLIFYGEEASL